MVYLLFFYISVIILRDNLATLAESLTLTKRKFKIEVAAE